jgi:hypothetical protein
MLLDKIGAVLGTLNVMACLALLAAAPTLGWPLWAITLACAALHATYNFLAYVVVNKRKKKGSAAAAAPCAVTGNVGGTELELYNAATAASPGPSAVAVPRQPELLTEASMQSKVSGLARFVGPAAALGDLLHPGQ